MVDRLDLFEAAPSGSLWSSWLFSKQCLVAQSSTKKCIQMNSQLNRQMLRYSFRRFTLKLSLICVCLCGLLHRLQNLWYSKVVGGCAGGPNFSQWIPSKFMSLVMPNWLQISRRISMQKEVQGLNFKPLLQCFQCAKHHLFEGYF